MRRFILSLCVLHFVFAAAAMSQTPLPVAAHFDVATIKPAHDAMPAGIRVGKNRLETQSTSLIDLIKFSYGVHAAQILGGPEPLMHERYDVQGTVTSQQVNISLFKDMVRTLLAERFQLKLHADRKELPVYVLQWERQGEALKPAAHALMVPTVAYGPGELGVRDASMHDLATFLQRYVTDRPVLDQTHHDGRYDLQLHWMPDSAATPTANGATQEYPDLFTAMRQQLGLRLQAKRELADVLVIDNVTAPTDN